MDVPNQLVIPGDPRVCLRLKWLSNNSSRVRPVVVLLVQVPDMEAT